MKTHTATVPVRRLFGIQEALSYIEGPKPIMVAYKFGKIATEAREVLASARERLLPFADEESGSLRQNLSEGEEAEVEELLDEEIRMVVPVVTLEELASLSATDDSAIMFLVECGLIVVN